MAAWLIHLCSSFSTPTFADFLKQPPYVGGLRVILVDHVHLQDKQAGNRHASPAMRMNGSRTSKSIMGVKQTDWPGLLSCSCMAVVAQKRCGSSPAVFRAIWAQTQGPGFADKTSPQRHIQGRGACRQMLAGCRHACASGTADACRCDLPPDLPCSRHHLVLLPWPAGPAGDCRRFWLLGGQPQAGHPGQSQSLSCLFHTA